MLIKLCYFSFTLFALAACDSGKQLQEANFEKEVKTKIKLDKCDIKFPQEDIDDQHDEPNFIGLSGFTGINTAITGHSFPSEPWKIPVYVQSGPENWVASEKTILAKSAITVIDQKLKYTGFASFKRALYEGVLKVRLENGSEVFISTNNFIPTDWWNCPILKAVRYSSVVALTPNDANPIDENGDWVNIEKPTKVLCFTDIVTFQGNMENPIACYNYIYSHGRSEGVRLTFDASTLQIIY